VAPAFQVLGPPRWRWAARTHGHHCRWALVDMVSLVARATRLAGAGWQMAVANPGRARLNAHQRFMQTPEGRLYAAAKDGDVEGVAAACAEGARIDVPHP